MSGSLSLCLGSTVLALLGLLALNLRAQRGRRRLVLLLVAAALLISAGFGAAETVYQISIEREEAKQTRGIPVSDVSLDPLPHSATPVDIPIADL